jgi:cell division protease FtsH
MVREFGLSETLGPIGYPEGGSVYLGGGGGPLSSRPFAEATQAEIDKEVAGLLRQAEARATNLLRAHRHELDQLTGLLLENETVDGAQVYHLVGQPDRSKAAPSPAPPATVAPRAVATSEVGLGPVAAGRPEHDK